MSSYQRDLSDSGLDIIRLQNDRVDVAIDPAAGGNIFELIDRRSGRNWLWQNPRIPLSRTQRGADFDSEQDSGGWDEILLSIKSGRIRSASKRFAVVPDHGDLIDCECSVDNLEVTAVGDLVCDMSALGTSAIIEVAYSLTNNGDEPLPAYWCAHPLIAVELKDGNMLDLSQPFVSEGALGSIASKIFVRTSATGAASVCLGENECLTFRFDPSELPWLGLWINNGGWSGCGSEPYTNLGFEPATSPYDCINEAIENEAVPWLGPGAERRWSLIVELQA